MTAAASALRRRGARIVVGLLALALVWTLGVGVLAPWALRPRIEAAGSAALGAPLRIGTLDVHPWALRVRLGQISLGPAAEPWFTLGAAEADLTLASLWHRAPVLEQLRLDAPRLHLVRLTADRYNLSPLLDALQRQPSEPDAGEPARYALHNIRVVDGSAELVDRVQGVTHRIDALALGLPFLSNLPADVQVEVEPRLSARVDGSLLELEGRSQPFAQGQRSVIEVDWQALDLAPLARTLAPWLGERLKLVDPRGRLDAQLQIAFERRPAPAVPSLHLSGQALLSSLHLGLPGQGAELAWEHLALGDLDLRPLERQARIGRLVLTAPAATLDLPTLRQQPAEPRPAPAPGPAAAGSSDGWSWQIDELQLGAGQLRLQDPAWPEGRRLEAIEARATQLGTRAERAGALSLQLRDDQGARLQWQGQAHLPTQRLQGRLEAERLAPLAWLGPWAAALPVRLLDGRIDAQAEVELGPQGTQIAQGRVRLDGLQLSPPASEAAASAAPAPVRPARVVSGAATATRARGSRAQPATADRLAVERAELEGLALTLRPGGDLQARAAALRIEGLALGALRDARGRLAWVPAAASPSPAAGAGTPAREATAPPRWHLDELRCTRCAVTVTDHPGGTPTTLAVNLAEARLSGLDSDARQPARFELAGRIGPQGQARLSGQLRREPLALDSRIQLERIDLTPLRLYADPYLNLSLASGQAEALGELQLTGTAQEPVASVQWRGRLALDQLRAQDRVNDADLLRWRRLELDGSALRWRPDGYEADLGQVRLAQFGGRIILGADGRLNLRDVLRTDAREPARSLTSPAEAASAAASAPVAAPAASASAPARTAALPLRWRGIQLEGGQVDFSDRFIRPNYSARLTGIQGEVSALTGSDAQPARVRLTGKVDDSAPLEIEGSVHPLGPRLQADLTARARGIDITRLSAYSARWAGYGIDKGSLSTTVHYRIADGRLDASNRLVLDQLSFGAPVESPDALKLPVLLAVSLLKDRNGVIDLDLPVSGSLDDPQFSIAGVVGRVVVNLITKAVTAPFTLLGEVFGGGRQQLSHVVFAPGSAELDEAARSTLTTLAKALQERPALKLEITGRADAALDGPDLRRQHVDQLLRAAKARATRSAVDEVTIEPAEYETWLTTVYNTADLKTRPRNALGLLQSVPPDRMAALLGAAGEGPEALRQLADGRAERVKAWLSERVPSERLLVNASRLDAQGTEAGSRPLQASFSLR